MGGADARKTVEEALSLLDDSLELHVDQTDAWITRGGFSVSMLLEGMPLRDFLSSQGGMCVEAGDPDAAVETLLSLMKSGGRLVWFEFPYVDHVREDGRVVRVPVAEDSDVIRREVAVPSFSTMEELRMKFEIGGKAR